MQVIEKIDELINEIDYKIEALPESYFISFVEKEVLNKLKNIKKYLQNDEKSIK